MGYVQDPDLLPGKGGSPGYQPGKQWDVKNQKYIAEPTGHAAVQGMQWRDDAGIDMPGASSPAPTSASPASADMGGAAPSGDSSGAASAMAGLQSAGPDPTTAGFTQKPSIGALNPRLGQRNLPDAYSGLKALTY